MCSCVNCKSQFTTANILRHHHSCTQMLFPKKPKLYNFHCLYCDNTVTTTNKDSKFCSQSCSAKFHNTNRTTNGYIVSENTKNKIRDGVKKYYNKPPKKVSVKKYKPTKEIVGPFSKITICTCKICSVIWVDKTQKLYCHKCHSESSDKRLRYRFKFNVYHYPDLFDLVALQKIGFYSPNTTSNKWNPFGLSRDHRISVSDAIKNNYDSFYISHPLNCELMPQKQNNIKKGKSSLTYDDLKQLVDRYEEKSRLRP